MDMNQQQDYRFSAELEYVPFFNLALQQNAVPVINELKLKNDTGHDLENIECVFSAKPALILPKTVFVESLKNGEELPIHDLKIELDYELLVSLSEALKGKLELEIRSGAEVLYSNSYDVEAFAADQWLGLKVMPELLAAFVTPNLDVVAQLQTVVAAELKKATGSPSIQGYQADKNRVYEICSAVYRAIHSWGIHYSNPPSSFGSAGQRIRLADAIYQYRLGTCLDTSILFASVLEQCGLHPVIMLQAGHAYIGCHLTERYFPDIPMDDLQAIRKQVDLDEFLVVETTMVTGDATFSAAEAAARSEHLNIDGEFQCAIDIVRARYSGIRPLPLKRSINGIELIPQECEVEELGEERKRQLQKEIDLSQLKNETTHSGRVVRWTQKLLDLSLRNRLLNVRDTRQIIPIACTDIARLEDKIAANEMLSLNPLSNLLGEKDLHDLAMLRNSEVKKDIQILQDKELSQRRLWTLLSPQEMTRRLTGLYRQSRTDLEEGGINTLFLAIGFLEWKVSERDEKSYLAPILLIPVRLLHRSMTEGIRISRLDEDTVINETLLELLRSQFKRTIPGISPLPADDSGVDVPRVMQIFRQSIKEMKGWEIREEARLGHFSFGKFIMWNDMTARIDSLQQNSLVKHLIEGGVFFDDGIDVFNAAEINRYLDLKNLYCPMSADSSQLAAVLYSQTGKNFVLHGPPGTGKSQTITNIIAHNLAMGRRVLFVSEKKAALEVVHRRLSGIGLKPFCLEQHSNKSGKSEVLAQFAEALNVPEQAVSGEWETTVRSMTLVRAELNEYVSALHKVFPNGLSAYDCFSRLQQKKDPLSGNLLKIDCLNQSQEAFETTGRLVSDLANAWQGTSKEALDALQYISAQNWSPVLENGILNAFSDMLKILDLLRQNFMKQAQLLELDGSFTVQDVYHTAFLSQTLKKCGNIPAAFLDDSFRENAAFLRKFAAWTEQDRALSAKLRNYQLKKLIELDFSGIAARIQQNNQAFFLTRYFRNAALLKELSGIKKLGGTPLTIAELSLLLPDAEKFSLVHRQVEEAQQEVKRLLGKLWNNGEVDWKALGTVFEQTEDILRQIDDTAGITPERKNRVMQKLQTLLPDAEKTFARNSQAREQINTFLQVWNDFQEKAQTIGSYAAELQTENDLELLETKLRHAVELSGELRGVLRYRKLRLEAEASGLAAFAGALENSELETAGIARTFLDCYAAEMLNQILAQSPVLCNFSGANQEERIRKFQELDAKYTHLSKQIIFARLAAALPRRRSGPCPEGTELGILKRECEKRARQKPVRQLLEQIPTLAPVLKPCFLMSPLSVAQYLPPDSAPFDLIIFDEASQIPVWDAIGVIARGKQLIVVGDPKQMPPTNFFQKGEQEDEEKLPDEPDDLESILDECIAAGLYSTCLNWHYRSRHEALISFSNHYYYEDRLFTFPAARNSDNLGIRFEFVPNAVYDRKAARTNRKEAEALVKYVFAQLKKTVRKQRSIGIVTFSQAQKDLIEDLLEQERAKHPELEEYFSDHNVEPLFVKNLENVQGDERDVILFSICYAPDAEGKFSMNFGPLNRQGGERRLNVAITRAKEQVVVFSSIRAQQIELNRTNATGAAHLKYFLDYAEKGFHIQSKTSAKKNADGLIDSIAEFLSSRGLTWERNVGCSGYRIDLAVRHPDRPDEFLLGIECDGPVYAAQRTARDRDNLRDSVLHSLGWHTCRAWSVDWVFDRKRAEEHLLTLIEKLRTEPESPLPPANPAAPEKIPAGETKLKKAAVPPQPEHRKEYRMWNSGSIPAQEFFYDPSAQELIRKQMREVIQCEGPVYETVLKKRVVKVWGFNRMGEQIHHILNECLPKDWKTTKIGDVRVFWAMGQCAENYLDYRISQDNSSRRTIDEIPPEELANAMLEVLMDFNSCQQDTLYRETVKLFGFSAVTAKARKYLDFGMEALKKSGRILK